MDSNKHFSMKTIFGQLFKTIGKKGTGFMALASVAVVLAGYLANLPAVYLGKIIDTIVISGNKEAWELFAVIVACLLGRLLLVLIQKYLVERTAVGVQKGVFKENVDKVLSARVDTFQNMRVGEVTVRLDKRAHGVVRLLKLLFLEALPQSSLVFPALILAFTQHAEAGYVMLVVLVLNVAVTSTQIISQRGIRIALINKGAILAGHVAELLSHLDFIRASGMGGRIRKLFEKETESIRETEFLHHKWMMSFDALKNLFDEGGLAIVVAVGIYYVANGEMTPGTILALAMLYKSASQPLQNLHRIVDELYESMLQINAASEILNAKADLGLGGEIAPNLDSANPIVVAKNLTLERTSPDGVTKRVLNNINVELKVGDVIGIAGPSGSGKSTFLKALLGLFPDYQGELRMFGSEVRSLSKAELADQISYGPQKPYVSSGSVRKNVNEGVTREGALSNKVIQESLLRAQYNVDINKELSEHGDNISPGEAQRLSLARVFAKDDARLVILDEATSMLDGQTQAKIISELRGHADGRLIIMVAHRLDTLSWANRILVLDEGMVVQDGAYNELASTPGIFARLLGNAGLDSPVPVPIPSTSTQGESEPSSLSVEPEVLSGNCGGQ